MDTTTIITQVQINVGVEADGIAGPKTWAAIYNKIMGQPAQTDDLNTIITAVQTKLGVAADGKPGPITWNAINNTIGNNAAKVTTPAAGNDADPVDSTSERIIGTLLPEVQPLARQLVRKAAAAGITIKIISGMRTYAEQDKLYAQGRSATGEIIDKSKVVTNARGGYSNHNFGLAFDIGVFENGRYMGESPSYKAVGPLGKAIGLSWGGDWKSIVDMPHYELRPDWAKNQSEKDMLAELRQRKTNGTSFFA